jgi:hypothetical protein
MDILLEGGSHDFVIHRGAPAPISLKLPDDDGGFTPFTVALVMRCTLASGAHFDMTVGNGITLSDFDPGNGVIANAAAEIRMTVAQSRLIEVGNFSSYEIQDGLTGSERRVLAGRLIGDGGENPDG